MQDAHPHEIAAPSPTAIWLLVIATTLGAGSMYYSQPLLGEIAVTFSITPGQMGSVPSLAQIGYVLGLLFITPLGDVVEKRKLIVTMLAVLSAAFLAAAFSPSIIAFSATAILIGMASVVVQILIPFVALLSPPEKRAENLGNVLSGALIGVLLSRTFSGYLGTHFGWRSVFVIAATVMFLLTVSLRLALPIFSPKLFSRYPALIHSLWTLVRDLPRLRAISLTGAMMYAALCSFWTPLAFFLKAQFDAGPGLAGTFGIIGVAGALAAKVVGRYVDKLGPRRVVRSCIGVMILAFAVMGFLGSSMACLVSGVLLLDLGAQAATVSNQSEIYGLRDDAQTRLNTIYKMYYFVGGSIGTVASAFAWQHGGWGRVCIVAVAFLLGAGISELVTKTKSSYLIRG